MDTNLSFWGFSVDFGAVGSLDAEQEASIVVKRHMQVEVFVEKGFSPVKLQLTLGSAMEVAVIHSIFNRADNCDVMRQHNMQPSVVRDKLKQALEENAVSTKGLESLLQ